MSGDPLAAVERALSRGGPPLRVVASRVQRWASATFTGHRVTLTIAAVAGAALEGWLAALPEAELAMAGRIVADCAVGERRRHGGEERVALALLIVDVA